MDIEVVCKLSLVWLKLLKIKLLLKRRRQIERSRRRRVRHLRMVREHYGARGAHDKLHDQKE